MSLNSFSNDISFLIKHPKTTDGGSSFTVTVVIQKQAVSGFSKFEIEIPNGFAIRALETAGARFIKKGNIGKFIWLGLPNSEEVNISYQVYVPLNASNTYKTKSTFYFLNQKEKSSTSFSSFYTLELKNINYSLKELNSLIAQFPDRDIYYQVQIGAYENPIESENLSAFFNIKTDIRIDFENGLYKYIVGPFTDYFKAKDFQEESKINGAFLVLYFIDTKISKEDALKIIGE